MRICNVRRFLRQESPRLAVTIRSSATAASMEVLVLVFYQSSFPHSAMPFTLSSCQALGVPWAAQHSHRTSSQLSRKPQQLRRRL